MLPTIILAREGNVAPAEHPSYPATAMTVQYEVLIPPRTPLHTGQHVKIYTLRPCDYLFPVDEGAEETPRFMAQDAGVEGRITTIRARGRKVTELVVTNENVKSQTAQAIVAIQHTNGAAVSLSRWEKLKLRLVRHKPVTADEIPMRTGAIVMWRTDDGESANDDARGHCRTCGGAEEEREITST